MAWWGVFFIPLAISRTQSCVDSATHPRARRRPIFPLAPRSTSQRSCRNPRTVAPHSSLSIRTLLIGAAPRRSCAVLLLRPCCPTNRSPPASGDGVGCPPGGFGHRASTSCRRHVGSSSSAQLRRGRNIALTVACSPSAVAASRVHQRGPVLAPAYAAGPRSPRAALRRRLLSSFGQLLARQEGEHRHVIRRRRPSAVLKKYWYQGIGSSFPGRARGCRPPVDLPNFLPSGPVTTIGVVSACTGRAQSVLSHPAGPRIMLAPLIAEPPTCSAHPTADSSST